MRNSWRVALRRGRRLAGLGLALAITAGCAQSGERAESAPASPSPSASPACDGIASHRAAETINRRSEFEQDDDLDILVIAAGEAICPPGEGKEAAIPISVTLVQYGGPGSRPKIAGKASLAELYDGTRTVRVPIPVLAGPCLGVVVHTGVALPEQALPVIPFMGVRTEAKVFDPARDGQLSLQEQVARIGTENPILGVASTGGPACTTTVKRK